VRAVNLIVALTSVLAASCQSLQSAPRSRATVEHVVVCWLKSPGDATARQRIIDESNAFLGVIPGLVRVSAGPSLPSTRPAVDSTFDVAVVMSFEDEAALRAYEEHPRHRQAVERVLRPLVGKLVIYDVVDRRAGPVR